MAPSHSSGAEIDPETLAELAADLATQAGARITAALRTVPRVRFKPPSTGRPHDSNPVTGLDLEIEARLREQIRGRYPTHSVLGEELPALAGDAPFTWVIDPLDGTTNFINGLPLFACSIGVLRHGTPVAGAIWCSTSHTLGPGVYHAGGSDLRFEGTKLRPRDAPGGRGLACEPGAAPTYASHWDTRVFGCAAIEFAFVAAGLLRIAYIPRPRVWDVAGGLALLAAAGRSALVVRAAGRDTMLYLPGNRARLRDWSEPLLIGPELDLRRARGGAE